MARRLLEDIVLAFSFMTRLPMPRLKIRDDHRLSDALWAMPLAGLIIGAGAGGVFVASFHLGFGIWLGALIALTAMVLMTGALHDDGLADFWDGVGGGHTPQQRIAIMRDSHIGTYGIIALLLTYAILAVALVDFSRSSMLTTLHGQIRPELESIIKLAIVTMLSRAALVVPFIWLAPAQTEGLAHRFGHPSAMNIALTALWPIAIAVMLLGTHAIAVISGAGLGAALITALAARYIRGYTGDVLGASIMTSLMFSLLAALMVSQ